MPQRLQEIWQRINASDRSRVVSLVILIALLVAVPLTVFVAQRQQELRQRAAQQPASPPTPGVSLALVPSNATKRVGDEFDVMLFVKSGGNALTGVYTTVTVNENVLDVVEFQPNPVFNTPLINSYNATTGMLRYATVDTGSANLTGDVLIGRLRLRASQTGSDGNVLIQGTTQITALGRLGKLPIDDISNGSYIVVIPTPIPTATPMPTTIPTATPLPTATPTPLPTETPIPTVTPTPLPTLTPTPAPPTATPTPAPGDIDGDGRFTILDFNIWRDTFLAVINGQPIPDARADVNGDGAIDLIDFSIWRNNFTPS